MSAEQLTIQATFGVALLALLIGHQLGDHIAQTDRQADNKAAKGAAGFRAMAGHLLTYHLTAGVVLAGTAFTLELPLSAPGVVAGFGFSVVSHAILDRRTPVRQLLRLTRSPVFAEQTSPVCGMYVADQALHWFSLLVSALLIARL
ncbi:DUF3307 domain-containing protein [Phytohabitans suffuscus]|uniref:DUF3307 domain-containing protein n=1 Tax=Phytohabitans suffuscus TaxID=624315 RepID=A0A6F8YC99_9ACTN|nr:DUF3307 domain-containing protein [Phytohabitans suffuscus]BCB83581.1 hypothetical protein Psuf_008940 [Phytohabitans suffuscus]